MLDNFTPVLNALIRHHGLTPTQKAIVAAAISWKYRSYDGLAEDIGMDCRTVKRHVKALGPKGMNVLSWKSGSGINGKANVYKLNDMKDWRIPVDGGVGATPDPRKESFDMALPSDWELGPMSDEEIASIGDVHVTPESDADVTPAILDKTKNNTIRDGDSDDTSSAEPLGEDSASDIDTRDTKEKNTKGAVTSDGVEQQPPTYDALYAKWSLSFFADQRQKRIVAVDQFREMAKAFPQAVQANSHNIKRTIYFDWPRPVAEEQLNFYNQIFFDLHGSYCWEPVEQGH